MKEKAAAALLGLGLLQMSGDVLGLPALKGLGVATAASPAPRLFSSIRGLETYSTRFFLEWRTRDGATHSVLLTPQIYKRLQGAYNRRNAYGAVLAAGPVLATDFFGRGALETQAEMDYVGDVLRELAPLAEKAGAILGLEDTISARDNVRIMERAKSPAVPTYYDVGNSSKGGFDVVEEIRWLGADRICEVHLKDNPHYLGGGPIDFPAVVDALADIRFSQWAQLETSSPSGSVEQDLAKNLAYIRGVIARRQAG